MSGIGGDPRRLSSHGIIESQGWKGPTRSSPPTVLPLPLLPQATKPYLVAPHPDASWALPGMVTPPPPWAEHSSAWTLPERKSFSLCLIEISSGTTCGHFFGSCLLPGRRGQTPPHHNLPSGSCRVQWGLPSVSSSPDWTIPAPSAASHKTCAPDLHQFHCPSLDMLQGLSVFLVVRGPKLNTIFWHPHQCWVEGDDYLPVPAGHTISNTGQDGIGPLGHLGTLSAHVQPSIIQHPRSLSSSQSSSHSAPSLQRCMGYCGQSAGPSMWPCWTSSHSPQPSDPAYLDPSEGHPYLQSNPPAGAGTPRLGHNSPQCVLKPIFK